MLTENDGNYCLFTYGSVIWSLAYEIIYLKEVPDFLSIFGMISVFIALYRIAKLAD